MEVGNVMGDQFLPNNHVVTETSNTESANSEPRRDSNAIYSKDNSANTTNSVHHHHRRKRSHVSPLARSRQPMNLLESLPYTECGLSRLKDHVEIMESADEDNGMASCNSETLLHNETTQTIEKSVNALKLTKLDPEFRDLISRYVCSDYVIHCLELAGFCSPYVVARMDYHQLQRLEAFVGHACSVMKSASLREHFVGPIFAGDPLKFKLPSGAACGILLAANEIRRRYRRTQLPVESQNVTDEDVIIVPDSCDQSFNDAACQTYSSTFHSLSVLSPVPNISTDALSVVGNLETTSPTAAMNSNPRTSNSPNSSKLELNTASKTGSAAMMASALHVTAAVVSGNGFNSSMPTENSSAALPTLNNSTSVDASSVLHPQTSPSPVSSRVSVSAPNTHTPTVTSNTFSSQPNFVLSPSPVDCGNGVLGTDAVILERLKQHSSASAIRLASRQFVNAYLMRGRDFDMEMELSVTPDGCKRVTGIFYCHLCRKKRERTSAVRFTIARNRYPVLSNVLSHLKTHFHYKGQLMSGLEASVIQQTQSLLKSAKSFNESFTGKDVSQSSGAFNCSNYRSDIVEENTLNPSNNSFLQPSVSVNQFHSHIKPGSADYTYTVDSEGNEDSNSVHPIFDSLSASSSHRLNSSSDRSLSPTRGLGLDVGIPSRQNTTSSNRCNALTS
ncbi:unnamed protein product [Trichobilharzia szidati]|nr:unnamed protein product [Trichobilharzia szidati]